VSEATIKSEDVVQALGLPDDRKRLVKNKQEALDILKNEAKEGDVVVVMAVGDFNRLGYEFKGLI
jgi:UDP-N-acetylmuramate-alanine ligase